LTSLAKTTDANEQRQILEDILAKVEKDTVRNNKGIVSAILEALLYNGYEQEVYDESLFHRYLENPTIRHSQIIEPYRERISFQDSNWRSLLSYRPINISQPGIDELFDAYLKQVVISEELIKKYAEYFSPHYLTGIVVTHRALNGISIEEYKAHFGEHASTQFEEKRNLEITWKNKRKFKHGVPVTLYLKVKNVPELTYKVFEVDTETYYKKNGQEISDSLDLDGLIPEKTYKFTYGHPKYQEHIEELVFEDITNKEKGVFIVELVGGGLSSRALIKKGSLKLLTQEHAQGNKLYIIDEDKRICAGSKTGIYIDGKFHKVNEQGYVLLPFNESTVSSQTILCHDGFSSLDNLYLPTENYSLSTAVIFNEESIVSGRKLRLVLKNRLLLNGAPITLKKLVEYNAEVQLTNYEGITNYKNFKDLTVSDSEDLVLELIVPPMLTQLTISTRAKLKNLLGKDVELSSSDYVRITRDENTDRFMTCHLSRKASGYFVEVRGKNGEAIPNRQVIVQFFKSFGNFNFTKELYTDANGVCEIGQLEDIKWIVVLSHSDHFQPRTFVLGEYQNRTAVTTSYNICQGEQLVVPSMDLALNRRNFELVQISSLGGAVLRSCFEHIAQEDGQLVLTNLAPGSYEFTYVSNPPTSLNIEVHQANRWESNPLFLELESQIIEVKAEAKQLSVGSVQVTEDKVSFKVTSNSLQNLRAHVLAYHHHSQLISALRNKSAAVDVNFSTKSTQLPLYHNSFRSNRVLSDEHVYVNERKSKQTFIGNTLDKPSILLHREKVRETKDDEEVLRSGQDFHADAYLARDANLRSAAAHYRMAAACPRGPAGPSVLHDYQIMSNLDYLTDSGRSFLNLKPNDQGLIELPRADLQPYSYVVVNVSDNSGNVVFDHALSASTLSRVDLRVAKAKEQGLVYSEDFFAKVASQQSAAVIEDHSNTSQYMVDDVASLLDVLLVVCGSHVNKTEIQKFKFLVSWPKLSAEEKFKKFDEFGGHELHVFTFFRDRAFFDAHVLPQIRFKAKKQTLDYLLLDERAHFEHLLRPENYSTVNMLEGVLLVHRLKGSHPEACSQFVESLAKRLDVVRENPERKKALYESILASKKIEEEAPTFVAMACTERVYREHEMEECKADRMMMAKSLRCDDRPQMLMANKSKKRGIASPKMMMKMECDMDLLECKEAEAPMKIEKYQKKGAAFEFKERQEYFKGQFQSLSLNKFWFRVAEATHKGESSLYIGEEVIEMINSSLELVLALTFADLPFERGQVDSKVTEGALAIHSTANLLIFCKRMEERKTETLNMELVVSQKFYDPIDKYVYDEKDPSIYTIKEVVEFLTAKVYEARVAFTNVGEASTTIKLITQIPQGAMPINRLEFFKIQDVSIASMTTQVVTFKFYFPSVGVFQYYPATIMKNNRFVASAKYAGDMKVVAEYSKDNKTLETLQDILNYGTTEDILAFMGSKNLFNNKIFDINKVRWLFKSSPETFKKAVAILKQRYFYDEAAWAYSIHHGSVEEFLDLIKVKVPQLVSDSQYVKIGDIEVDRFEPLEYDPLINPRAHDISNKKHNILNKAFKETYERFLKYCVEKSVLGEREKVILTAYLVLQDRIEEALVKLKEIDAAKVEQDSTLLVQFEYLRAYLSMYFDHPNYEIAKATAQKYADFPDLSWRKRFREIQKQLNEYEKGMLQKSADEKKAGIQEKSNKELADKSEYLSVELKENFQLAITHKNVGSLAISFYKLEMEILFSNDPFLEKDIMNFVSVNPNHLMKFRVAKSSEFKTSTITIPEELQKDSLFIQVKSKDKFEILKAFNSHLRVHTVEDYGLLNVSDLSGKCLSSVYVKCFSKKRDGTVKFYKDGYTDFRGSFDYSSLNSDSLSDIEKFGLFVYSAQHGSVILTAKPPSQVGRLVKDSDETEGTTEIEEDLDPEFEGAPLLE
jgi:hypothetical protein